MSEHLSSVMFGQVFGNADVAAAPDFGARLGALIYQRKRARPDGYSVKQLAADSGVSRTTIHAALKGEQISRRNAEKIAAALGLALEEMLAVPTATGDEVMPGQWEPEPEPPVSARPAAADDLEAFITDARRILRTLDTLPGGPIGREWKLEFLSGVEQAAKDSP